MLNGIIHILLVALSVARKVRRPGAANNTVEQRGEPRGIYARMMPVSLSLRYLIRNIIPKDPRHRPR